MRAFGELGFAPHVVGASARHDLATTAWDQPISLPVMIVADGVQAVHPDGEVAVARGPRRAARSWASARSRAARRGSGRGNPQTSSRCTVRHP